MSPELLALVSEIESLRALCDEAAGELDPYVISNWQTPRRWAEVLPAAARSTYGKAALLRNLTSPLIERLAQLRNGTLDGSPKGRLESVVSLARLPPEPVCRLQPAQCRLEP
jgi:hypothetical protein